LSGESTRQNRNACREWASLSHPRNDFSVAEMFFGIPVSEDVVVPVLLAVVMA